MTTPDNSATKITEHHPADHLCGQNHDPSLIHFARKCWQSGRESTSAQISALHSANEKLRGLFRELLDIAECDANTEENADVILRAQAAARAAEGGED